MIDTRYVIVAAPEPYDECVVMEGVASRAAYEALRYGDHETFAWLVRAGALCPLHVRSGYSPEQTIADLTGDRQGLACVGPVFDPTRTHLTYGEPDTRRPYGDASRIDVHYSVQHYVWTGIVNGIVPEPDGWSRPEYPLPEGGWPEVYRERRHGPYALEDVGCR